MELVGGVQSTQFGKIFVEHSPHTVLRQVLHESIVLLRHSEVALVFRFFSGSSLVCKGFLCTTAFFPLSSSEVAPSSATTFANFRRLTPDLQISRKRIQLLISTRSIIVKQVNGPPSAGSFYRVFPSHLISDVNTSLCFIIEQNSLWFFLRLLSEVISTSGCNVLIITTDFCFSH